MNAPCPVTASLALDMIRRHRDEQVNLAIESEADFLLSSPARRGVLAETFTEALYADADPQAMGQFHEAVAVLIIGPAWDHADGFRQKWPALTEIIRKWVDFTAETELKKDAA